MVQGGGGEGRSPQLDRPNGGEAADHEGSRTARGHARKESDGERGPENPLTWLRGRMDTDGVPSLPSFLPPPQQTNKKVLGLDIVSLHKVVPGRPAGESPRNSACANASLRILTPSPSYSRTP